MPVTLLLLLLAFGSLVAALLPLGIGVRSISMRWVRLRCSRTICTCRFGAESGDDARPWLGHRLCIADSERFREALAEGYDPGLLPILLPATGKTLLISRDSGDRIFSAAELCPSANCAPSE